MNSLHEIAKQCVAGQCALNRLAGCIDDDYYRGVLLVAAKVLQGYAREVYASPLKVQLAPVDRTHFTSLENVQTLVGVCRLRLELLEEAFAEVLAQSLPKLLRARVQRQADEFLDIQDMVQCVLQTIEPFTTLDTASHLSRFSSRYQQPTRGLQHTTFYAEA
jgi:hypothetical protein